MSMFTSERFIAAFPILATLVIDSVGRGPHRGQLDITLVESTELPLAWLEQAAAHFNSDKFAPPADDDGPAPPALPAIITAALDAFTDAIACGGQLHAQVWSDGSAYRFPAYTF